MSETQTLPNHLGIILDGNRRWAKERGLAPFKGHEAGADVLEEIADHAFARGVKYLTAFVFSTENWNRTEQEVSYLMGLITKFVQTRLAKLSKKNIKIVVLGSRERLNSKVLEAINKAETETINNTAGVLALCLNYGGHLEIVDAVKKLISSGVDAGEINEQFISDNLYHPEVPDIDLIVRTSGEQRLSNFMLWRVSYSELIFIDKHWPAFTTQDLDNALEEFASRQRRFGN